MYRISSSVPESHIYDFAPHPMQRLMRAAAGALARCSDGGLGAAGASAASATRAFHATGSAWEPLSQAHRSGMSATTVLCVRKGDQARAQLCF
jgi:hypothetical protein